MENWLSAMEFSPNNVALDEFLTQLRSISTAGTKKVWKHIVSHVRPRKEVELIKKQCLLHRLRTSTPPYYNIDVQLNSMKDFDTYLQRTKNQSHLKLLAEQVDVKKKAIEKHLQKLELNRKNILKEEEKLKESVYKLNHLKKKKKTVEKSIEKLENDTKMLRLLRTSPSRFVHYGANVSDWERKVSRFVDELPPVIEFETIVSKMGDLLQSSQFPPVPLWDRTETLSEMERMLLSKLKKWTIRKAELQDINEDLEMKKNSIFNIKYFSKEDIDEKEFDDLFETFVGRMTETALAVGRALGEIKTPYVLESELHTVRRLNHLIDSKTEDINKLLPIESSDYNSSDLELLSSEISLPPRPAIRKLMNSVSKEVSIFKDLSLCQDIPDHVINFEHPCISSHHQLLQFNNCMMIHSKLMLLEEKIRNLNLPSVDSLSWRDDISNKTNEFHSNQLRRMKFVNSETEALDDVYERVKAAINFLRKEPLNESLMGLEIENKDISYWIHRFLNSKKKHDHELWLLMNQVE